MQIYIFRNVRFASQPPRFGRASFPPSVPDNSIILNSTSGPSCYQVNITQLRNCTGGQLREGSPLVAPIADDDTQSEDCLFLDIYVPKSALENNDAPLLPVVVWFYGGAYAAGSKRSVDLSTPLYSGQGILEASNYSLIYVTGNYRLGALGWLAGSYFESELGLANAGLWDQYLLLQFVQNWIDQVGGNNSDVSAWGESAGAGSILHHLVRKDVNQTGTMFSKALLQSPAFEYQWDREGVLNEVYQNFSQLAGCGTGDTFDCLQTANINNLSQANEKLFVEYFCQQGLFAVGPAVDQHWITELPAVSFANGMSLSMKR